MALCDGFGDVDQLASVVLGVAPALNHENPEMESIVEQNERFAVVETFAGESSRVSRETNPRSQHYLRTGQPEGSS